MLGSSALERTGSFDPVVVGRCRADRAIDSQIRARAEGHGRKLFHSQKAWASITFSGTRHIMAWEFDGADAVAGADALIVSLPDSEISLPNCLVADACITSIDHQPTPPRMTVGIELLLLDTD